MPSLSPSFNVRLRPIEQVSHAPLASKVHSERGVTTLLNMCSSLPTSGTYVLGAIVVLQPHHDVEQHEVLRHVALSAVIAVAAAVAHTSPAEQLPNAFLFASSGCTAPQPPAGRPRRPPGTACGLERPGAPSSFDAHRVLRFAPRVLRSTPSARASVPWPLAPLPMQSGFSFSNFGY